MNHLCKICGQQTTPSHTIKDITYYHCPSCNFLQNYYWEGHPDPKAAQTKANNEARADRWPAGEKDHMYEKGWEMLQLMVWPPAWYARKINTALRPQPLYDQLMRRYVKQRLPRILDFGCGHGTSVLELAERDGFDAFGLDPFSPTDHPRIIRQELTDSTFPANHFDGIFSIETAEHLTNPIDTFQNLHRILKPGGILLMQTHHLEDPDYLSQGQDWFYLKDPTTHVAIYGRQAMAEIGQRLGFSRVSHKGVKLSKFVK